jgi:hypothetical protein
MYRDMPLGGAFWWYGKYIKKIINKGGNMNKRADMTYGKEIRTQIGRYSGKLFLLMVFVGLGISIPSVMAADVTDISVNNIEVTQGIQCLDQSNGYTNCPDNSLPLVYGKLTTIRVYIGHEGGKLCSPNNPYETVLPNVRVKLYWFLWKKGEPLPPVTLYSEYPPPGSSYFFNVPCTNNIDELRKNISGAARFTFKSNELGVGFADRDMELHVDAVVSSDLIKETNLDNNGKSVKATFLRAKQPLQVTYFKFEYRPQKTSYGFGIAGPYNGPAYATEGVHIVGDLMQSLYPMPVSYNLYKSTILYDGEDIRSYMNSETFDPVIEKLSLVYEVMSPKPDVLVGWLPNEATDPFPGKRGAADFSRNSYPVSWVEDQVGLFENRVALAHEVGHTRRLNHPDEEKCGRPKSGTIGEIGYDTLGIYPPMWGDTHDFMNPGHDGNLPWISPYDWNRLLQIEPSPEWADCSSGGIRTREDSSPILIKTQGSSVIVSGMVNKYKGIGEIEPLFHIISNDLSENDPNGEYCLDFSSIGYATSSFCFNRSFVQQNGSTSEDNNMSFSFVLPFPADADKIQLKRGINVLAERSKSLNLPDLTVNTPEIVGNTAKISWKATDSDNDPLQYIVIYSPDMGTTLVPVAIRENDNYIEINSDTIAGSNGSGALIRILASDGFNSRVADSPLFNMARKPPTANISNLKENTQVKQTEDTVLYGVAQDLEDGNLEDISWSSDRDGFLGKGSELVIHGGKLSVGKHIITMSTIDSDGQSATTSTTIDVVTTDITGGRTISGIKFEDINNNGIKDSGEPGIEKWFIGLKNQSGAFIFNTTTDVNGSYSFTNLLDGMYTVFEWPKDGWIQTMPTTGNYTVNMTSGIDVKDQDFGNFHDQIINDGIVAYYRGLGQYPNIVETNDLLKAAEDWIGNIVPPGFSVSITTVQLLAIADEWRNS